MEKDKKKSRAIKPTFILLFYWHNVLHLVEFSSEKNRYNFVLKDFRRKVEMLVSTRRSSENEVTKCIVHLDYYNIWY